ncbi:MAG: 30S ribosomal protein S12 methylthiotransferase RimO [Candidatus Schekmanbacteria bacterium]|nr:30S ribosomal protein S12 methylthiotransferase RimO [Candidatus Schekmanbacteria bacterium]
MIQKPSVGLISLGCAKNLVDSEVMLGLLKQAGYSLTKNAEEAEILIVNTCAFIDSAKEEAVNTIIEMGEYKKTGNCKLLIVTGCLAQRYKDELLTRLPEIDALIGTGQFPQIVQICENLLANPGTKPRILVGTPDFIYSETTPRLRTTPGYSSYLKIAEGCNHHCTYCIIPQLRGRLRSRPIPSIVKEAQDLARQGVKELNLIAQDTTGYGQDLSPEHNIINLLGKLARVEGVEWIRLLYGHPAHISLELLNLMAEEEKICPYIDLPLQHINDDILKLMGRQVSRRQIEDLLNRMRQMLPDLAIRTSLMVGFPGETDKHFRELIEFVRTTRFECLGVFTYSREEGTPAAKLPRQVSAKVKQQRRDYLFQIQQEIAFEHNRELIGQKTGLLVCDSGGDNSRPWGRTVYQAPEVDGICYIASKDAQVGRIYRAQITAAEDYDLAGEIVPYGG